MGESKPSTFYRGLLQIEKALADPYIAKPPKTSEIKNRLASILGALKLSLLSLM